jgi:hypothetical protein
MAEHRRQQSLVQSDSHGIAEHFLAEFENDQTVCVALAVDDMTCAICKEILFEPVTTPCGHFFCKHCLLRWLTVGVNAQCPTCRDASPATFTRALILSSRPSRLIENIIRRHFFVPCADCEASVHPAKLAEHAAACPSGWTACENAAHGCTQTVRRYEIPSHMLDCAHHRCRAHEAGCDFAGSLSGARDHEAGCAILKVKAYIDGAIRAAYAKRPRRPESPLGRISFGAGARSVPFGAGALSEVLAEPPPFATTTANLHRLVSAMRLQDSDV